MHSAALLALLPLALAAPSVTKRDSPAPVVVPRGVQLVEDSYIVKFNKNAGVKALDTAISSIAAKADFTYTKKFNGFAATLTKKEVDQLKNSADVAYIEQNAIVTIQATQEDAPWGLARTSSTEPGGSTFEYPDSAGEGVCSYIIDTGIDTEHEDFGGRAVWGENFTDDGQDSDGEGHGTHVAGTVGGETYGMAKKTSLIAVKVLDSNGSGTNAGVIAGMEYVAADDTQDCPNGATANMSLGGGFSQAVNDAADAIVDAGIFLAVAAGNSGADTDGFSPASAPKACTVGATDSSDVIAEFSNVGPAVDVLAPGVDIESALLGGGSTELSGTSMASPHVAGLGALLLGEGASADGLCDTIVSSAQEGAISGVPSDTVNLLIQVS